MYNNNQNLSSKEINPLQSLDEWEDDVLVRYPDPDNDYLQFNKKEMPVWNAFDF